MTPFTLTKRPRPPELKISTDNENAFVLRLSPPPRKHSVVPLRQGCLGRGGRPPSSKKLFVRGAQGGLKIGQVLNCKRLDFLAEVLKLGGSLTGAATMLLMLLFLIFYSPLACYNVYRFVASSLFSCCPKLVSSKQLHPSHLVVKNIANKLVTGYFLHVLCSVWWTVPYRDISQVQFPRLREGGALVKAPQYCCI